MGFGRVCVYCASSQRVVPRYGAVARAVGRHLAEQGIGLVYGGGSVGLMGELAKACLQAGGEVIGIIPERLQARELGYEACTELIVTPDMHTRKAKMADLSDAFVALPGGWGTWEELLEATTWTQLGYHRKPIGVLDVEGFYAPLRAMMERAVEDGFIRPEHAAIVTFGEEIGPLLASMAAAELPTSFRWLNEP